MKEFVIMPVEYTRSYYTCSGCDTAYKKYGNLMKHIKRPIFPRHNQSALTLIVVQEKLKIRDYISQFLGVLNQIWKSESCNDPHTSFCSQHWTEYCTSKANIAKFLKHQTHLAIWDSCLTHMVDTHGPVCSGRLPECQWCQWCSRCQLPKSQHWPHSP